MDKLEQTVASMLTGIKSDTEWTLETQHRELDALDQKLASAELMLKRGLEFIMQQRRLLNESRPRREPTSQLGAQQAQPMPRVVHQGPRQ